MEEQIKSLEKEERNLEIANGRKTNDSNESLSDVLFKRQKRTPRKNKKRNEKKTRTQKK